MKGVILAGGLGTRLLPMTAITNKHLLPIYDRPMVYYPIQALVKAGIKDIAIVSGGEYAGQFIRLIGNGEAFGLKGVQYIYQKQEGGIAEALGLTKYFVGRDNVAVILGDNIFGDDLSQDVDSFVRGAKLFLKKVPNPEESGVVEIKNGKIVSIVEKPKKPKSQYIQTGIFMYDDNLFDIISRQKPSKRGELEITDVNLAYLAEGAVDYRILNGFWEDAGTSVDTLLRASVNVAKATKEKRLLC